MFLVLGNANIDDSCINVIKSLKLPKIKFISFYNNHITSPEIFNAISGFGSLEKFCVGRNEFDKKDFQKKIILNIYFHQN